jgi:hypothetical protein
MTSLKNRLARVEALTPLTPPHVYQVSFTHTVGDPPELIAALRDAEIAKLGDLREPHLIVTRAFVRPRGPVGGIGAEEA